MCTRACACLVQSQRSKTALLVAPIAQRLRRIGSQMQEVRGSSPRLGGLRVSRLQSLWRDKHFAIKGLRSPEHKCRATPSGPKDSSESRLHVSFWATRGSVAQLLFPSRPPGAHEHWDRPQLVREKEQRCAFLGHLGDGRARVEVAAAAAAILAAPASLLTARRPGPESP